jgi:translocation and assembly module TamA
MPAGCRPSRTVGQLPRHLARLDSVLLPTEGYTLSLQGGLGRSHGKCVEERPLHARLCAAHCLPAARPVVVRPGACRAGPGVPAHGVAAPESQLFRAGGDDSVRGYGYRSLGPVVDGVVGSGPVLLTGSVELARPFVASMPSLWGAVFVDAGRAAQLRLAAPCAGLRRGASAGAARSGRCALDLAYGQELRKFRLHFSVGIAF